MSGEVVRDEKTGQFVKGASGNPAGRPVGVRNQTTLVKEFIESALINDLKEHLDGLTDRYRDD